MVRTFPLPLQCELRYVTGGSRLESALGEDTEAATLKWLASALEHTRSRGQTKVVGYLEEVADEVVFAVEMAARRTSLVEHLAPRGPDHPQLELR